MKLMIASDIHGSAYFCRRLAERFEAERADKLLLLGDSLLVLYLVPAAIGAGVAKLLHASVLVGAALGCCALSFVLNGFMLWVHLLVARARRSDG